MGNALTSFGGRRRRYRDFRGGVIRCNDPIRHKWLEFPAEAHYHNWLKHFLLPDVASIRIGRELPVWAASEFRRPLAGQMYTYRDGVVELNEIETRQRSECCRYGSGWRYSTIGPDEIFKSLVEKENLERARRLLSLHEELLYEPVMLALRGSISERVSEPIPELVNRFGSLATCDVVEVCLLRLHAAGEMDLTAQIMGTAP